MPIRIYALAKKLNMDSKELVDACAKAGITGKGSALASLTDEETSQVQEYLSKGKSAGAPQRPASTTAPSKPAILKSTKPASPSMSATPAAPTPTPTPAPAPAATTPTTTAASKTSPPAGRPISRDDYIGPANSTGKPKVIANMSSKPKSDSDSKSSDSDKPKPPASKEPVVKLAPMPQQTAPTEVVNPNEPAPQKPIMTLPKDAIRGAKEGSSAPLKQFTKQAERNKRAETTNPGGPMPPMDPSAPQKSRSSKKLRKEKEKADAPKTGLAGMASARASRQTGRRRPTGRDGIRRRTRLPRRTGANTAAPRKGSIVIELPCTVRSFSEASGIPSTQILRSLMSMGASFPNINAELDPEVAEMMAEEAGVNVEFRQPETLEDKFVTSMEEHVDSEESMLPRPPVVTFLGHVDHGKTSLLDRILGLDVVSGEAGGITQHIRAYAVNKDGKTVSFVDTPGHEAFTEMRARGANVTDIAVLVVAADDGVMPQTEEAISHARAAGVPIIVAMNKIDLPGADENKVYQDLSTRELLPTEWGGDIEVVKTSAITGDGIDDLLETLLLTAELHEYKSNPDRKAIGTCLEAQQEGGRGVVAKLIVQHGTLKVGDVVVCGGAYGRVKAMYDTLDSRKKETEAGPSIPVNVTGLDKAPEAGDRFYVLEDIAHARDIAEQRAHASRTQSLSGHSIKMSFEEFQRRLEEGILGVNDEAATLNLILRADVRGSIEAIQKELEKLDHPEVQIKILQASVGGVTVADVTLADASDAVIVGFNVIPDENARQQADQRGVQIRRYDVIYKVTEDLKSMLEGKLQPEEQIKELGRALVQRTFSISRLGTIAGCRVLAGTIERNCRIRVNRDGRGIGDYPLDSLKREKDDAKEVREGFECGIKLSGFNDLKEGDVLEAYKIEEIARTL